MNAYDELPSYALTLPAACEHHPWGDTVVKVRKRRAVLLDEREDGRHADT